MLLDNWARDHGIPAAAVRDLRARLGTISTDPERPTAAAGSEAYVQQTVRLAASREGGRLWRNNVGQATAANGAPIRFGLANDSAALNKRVKSSDLIGIRPVLITPDMTGKTIGQFVARECKRPGWRYTGTPREVAQLRFIELVTSLGGDAFFIDTPVNTL